MNESICQPTQSLPLPASKPDAMPTENHAASVGENAKDVGPSITLADEAKNSNDSKNSEDSAMPGSGPGELNRTTALAVAWTGLEWLAKHGEIIVFNRYKDDTVWIGIKSARVTPKGELIEIERHR